MFIGKLLRATLHRDGSCDYREVMDTGSEGFLILTTWLGGRS